MIEMLVGALILFIGIVIGRFSRKKSLPAITRDPEPICGCSHHYALHDRDGVCRKQVARTDAAYGKHYVDCGCQRYTGPEPLPTYTAELGPS